MAAVVRTIRGEQFEVEPGSLGFSVTIFVVFALFGILLILLRRSKAVGKSLVCVRDGNCVHQTEDSKRVL